MPAAPPVQSRSGEPIPGYRLRQRVGAGGYGEVWAAEAPGGLVKAIKFVYGQMDEARAAREFKSLNLIKGVRHPFLLSLERIEVVDGHLLIVSELADESLKDRFEKCVKNGLTGISRTELLDHLRDAADALDYMNTQHTLQHLDVKPENLLLVGGRIKVADFGLVKDLQEASGSLMGGLTPIYAPPEVFDGRPSRRSDQYSLAIVYQEMLTGLLPFPGKTTAQLAAQHLTAKPRLSALPVADQPVIEKALSKDPEHRYQSCREMVEALLRARTADSPHLSQVSYEDGSQGMRTTAMFEGPSPAALAAYSAAQESAAEQDMLRRAAAAELAAAYDAQGQYGAAEQAAAQGIAPVILPPPLSPQSLVDLPPLDVNLEVSITRPTLVVGLGGLASKTLQHLRRRLGDCSTPEQRARLNFLLADTDSREIVEATHGERGTALTPEETLVLPLGKSADYRNDSSKYLDWLSRRWLFNIPRSQQTEGIRPFGRLAFVDHCEEVMQALRGSVGKLHATAKSAGPQAEPRVVVVASASGGAASGMAADIVFAIRQILDEQQCPGVVDLILLHGTGRQPTAQELAAVNTFALLTELNQFLQPGGVYPGELACGVKARPASEPAIRSLYLAHLGHDLGIDDFLAGCKRVAEYLFLDLATPAGTYLDACRSAGQEEPRQELSLRSFGLCQIGFSEALVNRGTESLCQAVVQRWYGEPKPRATVSLSARIADMSPEMPLGATTGTDAELESLASGQTKTLGLDLDPLVQRLYLLTSEELGGHPDFVFQRIIKECPARPNAPPPVEKWFAGSARFFGARGSNLESGSQSPLQSALMRRMAEVVSSLGEQLREWLLALTEDPAARVYGAQWCSKWFRAHLKNITDKAGETRANIGSQLSGLEAKLALAAKTPARSAAKDAAQNPETLFLQHCQLRMYQLATQAAGQFAQSLTAFVAQANDQVQDFGRDIKHLAGQFAAPDRPSHAEVDSAALAQLQQEEERSANLMDRHFQTAVFASFGFRAALQGGQQRHELVSQLRKMARQSVLDSLKRVDLMAIVKDLGKPEPGGSSRLAALIASAQPWLQQVGGERRLVCVVGQGCPGVTPESLSGLVSSAYFEQLPAVVPAAACQVVFCYELGNVPLAHAAARLIDHRPEYVQAASRLHARTDIPWRELPL